MWLKSTGKIIYDPARPGMKRVRPGSFLIAEVDNGIASYYRWWVNKRYGLVLQHTAWKPHITIIDGKKPLTDLQMQYWKKYQYLTIDFEYSVEMEQQWKFWVLPVRSEKLTEIRKEFGFDIIKPFPFHITFGRMN